MKKLLICLLVAGLLSGCAGRQTAETMAQTEIEATVTTAASTNPATEPPTEEPTEAPTEALVASEEEHAELYLPGVSVEDVLTYFNEVCLDSEYTSSGNPNVVQKWVSPIYYSVDGGDTPQDLATIDSMAALLNGIEGCPGIYPADEAEEANLRLHFWNYTMLMENMGSIVNGEAANAVFHFLYDNNEIYDTEISVRCDVDQYSRNAFILEEIYNSLGAAQDTMLRPDSIIYQEPSVPQELTDIDVLLLQLLYHPSLECGMNAAQCEAVIRELYY